MAEAFVVSGSLGPSAQTRRGGHRAGYQADLAADQLGPLALVMVPVELVRAVARGRR
jgi:hypothetical protein